ncbi:MAG: leucine-rich repeat domain-containing protein, partial [Clostridia bacterium]|nr:leucine-rich repeat domain-containing protein [Clostridia bacterium]
GDGVTSIGERAFSNCDSLTSVEIPDSVITIGDDAFYYCRNLSNVEIGDGVTSIGEDAFSWCDSLTSVVIGDGVTSIGYKAFYDCTSLTSVYYKGTSSEWRSISIDPYNEDLTNATRYYYIENEADVPTGGGNYWHYDEEGNIAIW